MVGRDFRGDGRVGATLRHLLETVLENPERNSEEALREIAREYLRGGRG